MEAKELHIVILNVFRWMETGKLPSVMTHQDLVKLIEREAQEGGRRAWSALTYILRQLIWSCKKRTLWLNCFSLKGVHGKGSVRQVEYHREACADCQERVECLIAGPGTARAEQHVRNFETFYIQS